jgi:hypothetical protein
MRLNIWCHITISLDIGGLLISILSFDEIRIVVYRFCWVISLVPPDLQVALFGHFVSILLGTLEILRRAMWGLLRVEYEHIACHEKRMLGYEVNGRSKSTTAGGGDMYRSTSDDMKKALLMSTQASSEANDDIETTTAATRTTEGEFISLLESITQTNVNLEREEL